MAITINIYTITSQDSLGDTSCFVKLQKKNRGLAMVITSKEGERPANNEIAKGSYILNIYYVGSSIV